LKGVAAEMARLQVWNYFSILDSTVFIGKGGGRLGRLAGAAVAL
jgi:hypothetical protein